MSDFNGAEANPNLSDLEARLGVTFRDRQFLLTAVTHRSYLNENRHATQDHNERMEFLGDAVLELVATDFLYRTYPTKPEGELTAVRAAIVNTISLAAAATKLGVNDFLLMSKGETKDTGRARQYILANAFEAIIGAVYLDRDYAAAEAFIAQQLFDQIDNIVTKRLWQDPKSRLQELAQERRNITPTYQTLGQTGPDHDRVFTVGVYLKNELIAQGTGHAKQEAEQAAAEAALASLG